MPKPNPKNARRPEPVEEEQYDDQGEEEQPLPQQEQSELIKNTPWQAISFAAHAVVLLLCWSMVTARGEEDKVELVPTAVEPAELPDPPRIQPQTILPEDRVDKEIKDPTTDPRITEDAKDDHNEDPTDNPTEQDLRPNPNPDQSNVESPYPNKGFNSSIGLGGNVGGGGGPGGKGGFKYRRARGGGGTRGDKNVLMALRWLRDHQSEDGKWDPVNYQANGRKVRTAGEYGNKDGSNDKGWAHSEAGCSGLALLAFLGAGFTHQEGEFQHTVKNALKYLKAIQDNEGCFDTTNRSDDHFVYGHAICAMAMAEAYAMTGSNMLKGPAQKAVDFIASAQNQDPDRGWLGWRYGVKPGDSDSSVTGWMVLCLKSAKVANLEIPEHCWEGAKRLLDDMTGPNNGYPKTGYITKAGPNARLQSQGKFVPNESMSAINVLSQLFMDKTGSMRNDPTLKGQAGQIISQEGLPTLDDPNKLDYYYWYYASLAMFQMADSYWKAWEKPMGDCVIKSQRAEGDDKTCTYGSWDSNDAWGIAGGRCYSTAINCLTLEVYYRYEKIGANKGAQK